MARCKQCGRNDIPDGAGWCCWCGTKLIKTRAKKKEASIPQAVQLNSGTWRIQLTVNGKRHSITAPTERECIEKARAIKAGLIEVNKSKSITLTKAIDNYIESKSNILSPSTIRGYREIQRNRFKSYMDSDITKMTDHRWQTAVNDEARIAAPKTVKNAWMFLSSVIAYAGLPKPKVTLPQQVAHNTPFLSPNEIDKFVAAVHSSDIEVVCLLGLSSLRASEAHALRWEDVDLTNRTIHVRRSVVKDESGKYVEKTATKNLSSNRIVPIMMDSLYEALNATENKEGLVVKMSMPRVRKQLVKACQAAGVTTVSFHGLRHSFASLAAHIGMPEAIAMQIGGWANDKIMKRIYTHVLETDVQRYQNEMSGFYNSKLHTKLHTES